MPLGLNCAAQLSQIHRLLDHVPRWLRLGWISEFPGLRSAHGCGPSDAVRSDHLDSGRMGFTKDKGAASIAKLGHQSRTTNGEVIRRIDRYEGGMLRVVCSPGSTKTNKTMVITREGRLEDHLL